MLIQEEEIWRSRMEDRAYQDLEHSVAFYPVENLIADTQRSNTRH